MILNVYSFVFANIYCVYNTQVLTSFDGLSPVDCAENLIIFKHTHNFTNFQNNMPYDIRTIYTYAIQIIMSNKRNTNENMHKSKLLHFYVYIHFIK